MKAKHLTKTTKARASKKHIETEPNESTNPMPAHKSENATSTSTVSNESESATMKTTTNPPVSTSATSSIVTDPTPPSAAPPKPLPYIKAPPPITLPPVPAGVVTIPPATLRGQLPRKQELELMPDVVSEMARFDDYPDVFGKTAPSKNATEQTLSSAYQWSYLRIQLMAWATYAQSQEVMAWVNARAVIERLSPAFALAVKTDSSIGVNYPSLGSLFGVRASIAKRSAAVRAANLVEEKAGRAAYKGQAGKRRKAADAKAALATQEAAEATEAAQMKSGQAAPVAGTPVVAATVATPVGAAPIAAAQTAAVPVVTPPALATPIADVSVPAAPVTPALSITPPAAPVNVTTVGHS